MPKPISWSYRTHEIRERIQRSRLQSWSRHDLEDLFEVKRASAQSLMRTIGSVQNIGGTHLIDREALLEFIEQAIQAENLSTTVQQRRLESGPAPRPKKLTFALPAELRTVMAGDLPPSIQLEFGKLTITGADSVEIIEALYVLAQAMQNDLDTIQNRLDPAPVPPPVEDDELRQLFRSLAQKQSPTPQSLGDPS